MLSERSKTQKNKELKKNKKNWPEIRTVVTRNWEG